MKKILIGCCAIALAMTTGNVFAQSTTPAPPPTMKESTETTPSPFAGKIKFDKETIDFGTTKLNKPVTVQYEFTNISKAPIIIESAQPSCGCTTPDWTKEPVLPGKKGIIKATYNAGTVGHQNKVVFVNFKGIDPTLQLHLTGDVEK